MRELIPDINWADFCLGGLAAVCLNDILQLWTGWEANLVRGAAVCGVGALLILTRKVMEARHAQAL